MHGFDGLEEMPGAGTPAIAHAPDTWLVMLMATTKRTPSAAFLYKVGRPCTGSIQEPNVGGETRHRTGCRKLPFCVRRHSVRWQPHCRLGLPSGR